jgi:organic radical activating enzyme
MNQNERSQIQIGVSEIFYSLQGEGLRTGEPTIFIRTQGCSMQHACYQSGVVCDTEFESGQDMTLDEISDWIEKHVVNQIYAEQQHKDTPLWITWTGGEPTDQVTDDVAQYFKMAGFKQSIETSGIRRPPSAIDFVSLSPKIAEHAIIKQWQPGKVFVDEIRYVRHAGQSIPELKEIQAKHYYLSPHFDGWRPNSDNIEHCIELCKSNPQWKLSMQTHKLIGIL